MKKRLIKSVSLFQIYLLIVSIISFSLILNVDFVSAANKWVEVNGVPIELNTDDLKKAYKDAEKFDSLAEVQEKIIKDLQSKSVGTVPIPTKGGSSMLSGILGIKDPPKEQTPTLVQTGGSVDAIVSGAQYAGIGCLN